MVPPKGEPLARAGSTWIHWKSSIAFAKVSMRSWVTSTQGETPTSLPTSCSRSRMLSAPLFISALEAGEIRLALLEKGAHRLLRLGRAQALEHEPPFLHDSLMGGLFKPRFHQSLGETDRLRRQRGQQVCRLLGSGHQIFRGNNFAYDPYFVRLLRGERLAEQEQLGGTLVAGGERQQESGAELGHDAERHEGQLEARV